MKIKIQSNKLLLLIIIFILLLSFTNPIFARYYEILEMFSGKAIIAEPIVKIESLQDTIEMEINKETRIKEYNFVIRNYENIGNIKRINEVDFLYDIEIKNSSDNFPIKYELYCVRRRKRKVKRTK